jgi:hypothetical protein
MKAKLGTAVYELDPFVLVVKFGKDSSAWFDLKYQPSSLYEDTLAAAKNVRYFQT